MKQENYKALLLKLSGTALGLVVMLGGAVALSQNFLVDKSSDTIYSDSYASSSFSSEKFLSPELELKLSLNEELKVVIESSDWMADRALKSAVDAIESMKLGHFDRLLEVNSYSIEKLNEAIEGIAQQMTIPSALKEEILANLEQQLAKAEKKLNALEDQMVTFSYKMFLPHLKYSTNEKCSQQDIIVEKCDGGKCAEDGSLGRARGNRKGSFEAFYWI